LIGYTTWNAGANFGILQNFPSGTLIASDAGSALLNSGYMRITTGAVSQSDAGGAINTLLNPMWWRGDAVDRGVWELDIDLAIVQAQSTMKIACGLFATGVAPPLGATFEPSANVNCIFLGADSGDANLQIMYNDASGACTKADLGGNFPKSTGVYVRLSFVCLGNGAVISYNVHRLDASVTDAGSSPASNIPSTTTFMNCWLRHGNGATAADAMMGYVQAFTWFAPVG
jgi:hypothetical protein